MNKSQQITINAFDKGYRIRDDGTLISPRGIEMTPRPNKDGYLFCTVRLLGSRKTNRLYLHRLMAYQKFDNRLFQAGIQVRHLNGNPSDNSFNNIEIGSQSENKMDIPKEKRIRLAKNAASYTRRFTEQEAEQIKQDRNKGMSLNDLMRKYNCPKSTMYGYIKHEQMGT